MKERLEKIEQRAEALGWKTEQITTTCHKIYFRGRVEERHVLGSFCDMHFDPTRKEDLEFVERLLSLHEPGLTVKVKQVISPLRCHEDCDLFLQGRIGCVMGWCDEYHMPGSDCREGTFKLVRLNNGH